MDIHGSGTYLPKKNTITNQPFMDRYIYLLSHGSLKGPGESIIQFHDHMFRPSLLMKNTCDEFRVFGKKRTENVFGKK